MMAKAHALFPNEASVTKRTPHKASGNAPDQDQRGSSEAGGDGPSVNDDTFQKGASSQEDKDDAALKSVRLPRGGSGAAMERPDH